jgi:glycerate kinase
VRVLVVPDKFKGTLTAAAAAESLARGWRKARPNDFLDLLPMSDGGDGFGETIHQLLPSILQTVRTLDAAHRPCRAKWWWSPKTKTALIESATVVGLAMLPARKFHPFELDTFGLGGLVRAAAGKGATRCIVGIGGSATNDGGFGLARAMGWTFLDRDGKPILEWTGLTNLRNIRAPKRRRWLAELLVAVDVQNPLLGSRGATRVYGPQKGLRPRDFARSEQCLRRLAEVVRQDLGLDLARLPGAGAAGGLGFGLAAFLGARLEPGFTVFARHARLEHRLRLADLVITGEGTLDRSTLMGKGVGEIAKQCLQLGIPCVGVAGTIEQNAKITRSFTSIAVLTQLTSSENAKANAALWLERLAQQIGERTSTL